MILTEKEALVKICPQTMFEIDRQFPRTGPRCFPRGWLHGVALGLGSQFLKRELWRGYCGLAGKPEVEENG